MDLLFQIKARVTQIIVAMENLPFLSNDVQSQLRSDHQPESDWPEPPPQPPDRVFSVQNRAKDPFEFIKEVNPIGLILIGIVIGVMMISMRPIVVQSAK
jgi:hypothetical protein